MMVDTGVGVLAGGPKGVGDGVCVVVSARLGASICDVDVICGAPPGDWQAANKMAMLSHREICSNLSNLSGLRWCMKEV